MNIPDDLLAMLNAQVTHERTNEATYRKLAAEFDRMDLLGFCAFMMKQADGEHDHADKIMSYIQDRVCRVDMQALPGIDIMTTPQEMVYQALALEQSTTAKLVELHRFAGAWDSTTEVFLQWFLVEQVEEEKLVGQLLSQFNYFTDVGLIDEYAKDLAK
jgi:ferritin